VIVSQGNGTCHSHRGFLVSEGVTLLATTIETCAAIACSAVLTLLLLGPAVAVAWIAFERCIADADSYDRAIDDVQRFIDLTERSRAQLRDARRLPLFDEAGAEAASAAIERALALKHKARRALWTPLSDDASEQTMTRQLSSNGRTVGGFAATHLPLPADVRREV
jgi:hypothetical protein